MSPEKFLRVEELYHAAREGTPEERAALLAQTDPDLRFEVELLLSQPSSGEFLNRPAIQNAPELLADSAVTGLAPGLFLGPYCIESKLGEGGMGVVYKAFDTKLNRPVAVKLLSDRLADAAARRRFQREAQTASSLHHPHILTVYDAGELEGRQYLVTEYIDGGTLREWSKAGKRTWREIVELLTGVADGLATAHEAKILHRDIKSANISRLRAPYRARGIWSRRTDRRSWIGSLPSCHSQYR